MLHWLDVHCDTLICLGTFGVFALTAYWMRGTI